MRGDIHRKTEIRVANRDWGNYFDFLLMEVSTIEGESSTTSIAKKVEMVPLGHNEPAPAFLSLKKEVCQQLMDELYFLGFKPSEYRYANDQIKAMNDHLQDMRAIVALKLSVTLPSKSNR